MVSHGAKVVLSMDFSSTHRGAMEGTLGAGRACLP